MKNVTTSNDEKMMEEMVYMFLVAAFVSFFAVFLLLLAYKWKLVEWLQVHGSERIAEMAHCDFCMSWWLCVLLTVIVSPFFCQPWLLAVPFIATPITRHLL